MRISQAKFSNTNTVIVLALIMLAGALLRLYRLEFQPLWNDELATWRMSHFDTLAAVIIEGVRPDVHPPGYQIFIYFVEQYFGDTAAWLRLPSVISGILAIYLIFLVGRELYSAKEGLIAALLMAILWAPIYYSQEARAYSMLLLFGLLTSYFWIIGVRRFQAGVRPSTAIIAGYIISAIVCSYLHYFGLFWIGWQGLAAFFVFVKNPKKLGYIIAVYLVVGLAYLPWLPSMLYQMANGSRHIAPPEGNGLTTFLFYLQFMFNWSGKLQLLIVFPLYGFLLLYNLYQIFVAKEKINLTLLNPDLLLLLWLTVPFTVTYLISVLVMPVLLLRNLIMILPAAYLLLARAITRLPVRPVGQIAVIIAVAGLFMYQFLFSMNYYTEPTKGQSREAVKVIATQDHQYQDALVIGYPDASGFNYYFEKHGSARTVDIVAGQENDIAAIDQLFDTNAPRFVWFVRGHESPDPEFVDFLSNRLTLIDHQAFIDADVWLFENR